MTTPNPRLLMIYCGGTIGMVETAKGLQPNESFAELINQQLAQYAIEAIDILSLQPLIDSANATPQDWVNLIATIQKYQQQYDGFIVLHGTDTLAYSAAALSLWCDELGKAIILTGAQKPMMYADSDGLANLLGAIHYACHPEFTQVAVYFGGVLLNPRAVRKVHAQADQAFATPNFSPWGEQLHPQVGDQLALGEGYMKGYGSESNTDHTTGHANANAHMTAPDLTDQQAFNNSDQPAYALYSASIPAQATLASHSLLPSLPSDHSRSQVALLHLTPAMTDRMIEAAFADDIKAVVLLSYGVGNIPESASLTRHLQALSSKGQWVINCTQCLYGHTAQNTYAAGVRHEGVFEGKYISYEFAYVLSYFAVQLSLSPQQISAQIDKVNEAASECALP